MNRATRAEVLAHPTWEMGPKISVDSATLMNKGLEIIEAHVLFGVPYAEIDVVVHPGSIIHSLALFQDGAMMAQLGQPDMRVPLLYAISGERHEPLKTERLDLAGLGALHFEAPDDERFPCLNLARQAGEEGGVMTVGLNAANEVAVEAFLKDRISYPDIHTIIASTLDGLEPAAVTDLDHALSIDTWARQKAAQCLTVQGRGA
jgi:1-deoxy-D-xylulose-5-phosphate reductoisomerase